MLLRILFIIVLLVCSASKPVIALEKFPPTAAPIYFDSDRTDLKTQARQQLAEVATLMQNKPTLWVKLIGHSDERSTAEFALAIGEKRAKAVMNYLIHLGIAPERISVESHGKEQPYDLSHNKKAWTKNRRVELVFLAHETAP